MGAFGEHKEEMVIKLLNEQITDRRKFHTNMHPKETMFKNI